MFALFQSSPAVKKGRKGKKGKARKREGRGEDNITKGAVLLYDQELPSEPLFTCGPVSEVHDDSNTP